MELKSFKRLLFNPLADSPDMQSGLEHNYILAKYTVNDYEFRAHLSSETLYKSLETTYSNLCFKIIWKYM